MTTSQHCSLLLMLNRTLRTCAPCCTCEKVGSLEPAIPLVATSGEKSLIFQAFDAGIICKGRTDICILQTTSWSRVGIPGSPFPYNGRKMLVHESAMDKAIQKMVSVALLPTNIYWAHHHVLALHLENGRYMTYLAEIVTTLIW